MLPPILLVDCDGVVCDWNTAFLKLLNIMHGTALVFPYAEPTQWAWPEHELGFTSTQVGDAWQFIDWERGYFWERDLAPEPGARDALSRLSALDYSGNAEVYFVTARPSQCARWRTARWLKAHGYAGEPGVIVCRDKGTLALALKRSQDRRVIVIDDKPENLDECREAASALYLVDHRYNRWCDSPEVTRVGSVGEALEREFRATRANSGVAA